MTMLLKMNGCDKEWVLVVYKAVEDVEARGTMKEEMCG